MSQSSTFHAAGTRGLVHPNAPAGGCGPGPSRCVGLFNGGGSSVPHVGSPAARHTDWASTLHAQEMPSITIDRFQKRIAAANGLDELVAIASDIAKAREELLRTKAMTVPEPGDKPVRDVIDSIVTVDMNSLQKIAYVGLTELVATGATAADAAACAEAFSKAIDEWIKAFVGKTVKELRGAIKKRDVTSVLKVLKAAGQELATGLKDPGSFLRRTMQLLKARGINVGEAALAKWMFARAESFSKIAAAMLQSWSRSPIIIIARLLLTPSNSVSDSEVLFIQYRELGQVLQARVHEVIGMQPLRAVDRLRNLQPSTGPTLRAAP